MAFSINTSTGKLINTAHAGSGGGSQVPTVSIPVSGLTSGKQYDLVVQLDSIAADWGFATGYKWRFGAKVEWIATSLNSAITLTVGSAPGEYRKTFTANTTSGTIKITPPYALTKDDGNSAHSGWWATAPVTIDRVALLGVGVSYFDGDTPDSGAYIYSWSGTANASQSTFAAPADTTQTKAQADIYKRNWLVV
jgi:hypothetical protein